MEGGLVRMHIRRHSYKELDCLSERGSGSWRGDVAIASVWTLGFK